MPIAHYGVFKGRAVEARLGSGDSPHYQVRVVDEADEYRLAINVRSQDGSDLSYVLDSQFQHPIRDGLVGLGLGFHPLPSKPGGDALDYIRGNLARPQDFVPLPFNLPGPDNDLNEKLDHYVQRALADESALVHAFGQKWGPESQRDKIFGFKPGEGIHDIHMNQGNDQGHASDDGVYQDGGLLFQFPKQKQWVAVFLKFQSQAWHTDDKTGHTLAGPPPPPAPGPVVPPPVADTTDGIVRIVGALVNDSKTPERELVTLLNASDRTVDLTGWALLDKAKNRVPLSGGLEPGAVRVTAMKPPASLPNKGGLITLVDAAGRKVDGVSYTKEQAARQGWTLVF